MAKRKAAASKGLASKKVKSTASVPQLLSVESIDDLAMKIQNDRNYNAIVELLGQYPEIKQRLTDSKDEELEEVARHLTLVLAKQFQLLFETNMLVVKKSFDEKKALVVKWLLDKYNSFKNYILEFLATNLAWETSLQLDMLDIYQVFLTYESKFFSSDDAFFPNVTYQKLVFTILNNEVESDFIVVEFQEKFHQFWDLRFYFYLNLSEKFMEWKQSADYSDLKLRKIFDNYITITLSQEIQFDPESLSEIPSLIEKLPSIAYKPHTFKTQFQKAMIAILSFPLTTAQYKHVLLYLHKRIIPFMAQPQSLMDFLTAAYDVADDDVVPILALNSLYELMKRYNLEYPDFYTKLYSLLTPNLLYTRYRSRFFRLCDLFLSSTHLSSALVASFIKRLARLSLRATAAGTVIVIPFIYNLMKRHPTCMVLIHCPEFQAQDFKQDPFDEQEIDPLKTNAIKSSLWEVDALMNHYHPNIATLAKIFAEPFRKPSYKMEDFLDWSYTTLLQSERTRKYKNAAALEYQERDGIFDGEDTYLSGWAI